MTAFGHGISWRFIEVLGMIMDTSEGIGTENEVVNPGEIFGGRAKKSFRVHRLIGGWD
jgi:hypothetical protein